MGREGEEANKKGQELLKLESSKEKKNLSPSQYYLGDLGQPRRGSWGKKGEEL